MKLEYTKIRIEISDGVLFHQVWQMKKNMEDITVYLNSDNPGKFKPMTFTMVHPRTLTKSLAIHFVKRALEESK